MLILTGNTNVKFTQASILEKYFNDWLKMKIISGRSNIPLATKLANNFNIDCCPIKLGNFSDGEIQVELQEDLRGEDVFIIQSTCKPQNDNLMELLIIADALRRNGCKNIIAIIPYFGYARQDRKSRAGTPISAKLVADMITASEINEVITFDLHSSQIEGFFNIPINNLSIHSLFQKDIERKFMGQDIVIVSPDAGSATKARNFAKMLKCDFAIIDKKREKANQSEAMSVIGDISGRNCIIIDDMIDTAGTLCNAANKLDEEGAKLVSCYATHGIFSGKALQKIQASVLESVVVTNTIHRKSLIKKIRVISISSYLSDYIRKI